MGHLRDPERRPGRACRTGLFLWCAFSLLGCRSGPRAPALGDEPVYNNSREGFRFLVPEGWTQSARGEAPPGKVQDERMLVEYKLLTSDRPAALQVTVIDRPESTSLEGCLSACSFGIENWRRKSPLEQLTINEVAASRIIFTSRIDNEETIRDVVVFRRGERVYFFTGIFPSTDSKAREQVRRAVESVIWKS
jgi:predicted Zn-dependent protease